MRPVEEVERLIKDVPVITSVQRDDEIRDEVLSAMEQSQKVHSAGIEPSLWRIIMKSQITKLATAAVVLMAVFAGIHFLGGSFDGTSLAWADVSEQISTFQPYTNTTTVQYDGRPDQSRTVAHLSLTQRREIRSNGTILVFDLSVPKCLTLMPERKHAIERIYDMEPTTNYDLLELVKSMESRISGLGGVQEIGVKNIDGHVAKGFRSSNEINDITVWADVQTKLPVLVKVVHVGQGRIIIMSDFTFDVKLDEALFSTTAPEGYTVEKVMERSTEKDLVEGLRAVAVFLEGKFPHEIELRKLEIELNQYVRHLSKSEAVVRLTPVAMKWKKAQRYTHLLKGELRVSDFHYAGDGVKLGEAGKPIVWWRPKDSETYRVVYGDLNVRDVAPEDLPK